MRVLKMSFVFFDVDRKWMGTYKSETKPLVRKILDNFYCKNFFFVLFSSVW